VQIFLLTINLQRIEPRFSAKLGTTSIEIPNCKLFQEAMRPM